MHLWKTWRPSLGRDHPGECLYMWSLRLTIDLYIINQLITNKSFLKCIFTLNAIAFPHCNFHNREMLNWSPISFLKCIFILNVIEFPHCNFHNRGMLNYVAYLPYFCTFNNFIHFPIFYLWFGCPAVCWFQLSSFSCSTRPRVLHLQCITAHS